MPRCRIAYAFVAPALVLVSVTACGNSNGLPAAGLENVVDTVHLFALNGTPLADPSGFNVQTDAVVRTDQTTVFDFAFNIDSTGKAVLLPTGALRLGIGSGIQLQTVSFDAVTSASTGTYVDTLPVVVDSGSVVVVHSRASACSFGSIVFYYGKFEVLAIDTVARRIDLQALVDQNCGYRGLSPGFPSN
jgi:hypothetical protein